MAEERTFSIDKNRKSKRDRSLVPLIVGVIVFSIIVLTPAFKYMNHVYQFNSFMDDLHKSFLNAENFKIYEFKGEYGGQTFDMDKAGGSRIFTELNFIGIGTRCEPEEMEDPFFIDFGDGTTLLIGTSTMLNRHERTVKCLYLEYTYENGDKYCYKTDQTEFHYLLDPVIAYYTKTE